VRALRPRRGGRWLLAGNLATILATLTLASGAFGVLTATTETTRLAVRGTVDASAVSAGYDILVRPAGSRSPAEEQTGLVQPGFLGAVKGGISVAQWHRVQQLQGVSVAAPVAVVGWVITYATVQVDLGDLVDTDHPVVVRTRTRWTYDNGASVVTAAPALLYITPNPIRFQPPSGDDPSAPSVIVETKPDGSEVGFVAPDPLSETVEDAPPTLLALSTRNLHPVAGSRSTTTVDVPYPFPFLLAAVDPVAESALTGVDRAMVEGAWLTPGAPARREFHFSDGTADTERPVPVAVANAPSLELDAASEVDVFDGPEVTRLAEHGYDGTVPAAFLGDADRTLGTLSANASTAYARLLSSLATPTTDGYAGTRTVLRVLRTSPLTLTSRPDGTLVPKAASTFTFGWGYGTGLPGAEGSAMPPGGNDTPFRTMDGFFAAPEQAPPALMKVGVFDPSLLAGAGSLAALPLGTFAYSAPTGADPASRAALGGRGWYPSANIRGYTQPPPLMLTNLDTLEAFSDPGLWSQATSAGMVVRGTAPVSAEPISAIRVKVAGVSGVGDLDRERVRSVAEAIAEGTGLDVDITMGASTGDQHVRIASGTHGRPALDVLQPWVVKGVATRLVTGIDQASAALALIVLVAAALVVLDAVFATVRARRREVATVLALGWRGRDVAWGILAPVLAAAVLAGTIGALAAFAIRRGLGLTAPSWTGLAAVPAALVVALLAATWPALTAARTAPTAAMAPVASARGARLAPRVASVAGAAWRSLAAAPGRAAASTLGAATATAALGTLRTIQDAFSSRAVGTVLGDAVTVQVRTPDLVAAGLTALLAGAGIYHVVATEVRERRTELGTLSALGWRPRTIDRLLVTQALLATALGVLVGTAVVVLVAHGAFAAPVTAAIRGSALAGGVTLLLTALATAPALLHTRRSVPAQLLRGE